MNSAKEQASNDDCVNHRFDNRDELEKKLLDRLQYAQYSLEDIHNLIPHKDSADELAGIKGFLAFTAAADRQTYQLDPKHFQLANEAIKHSTVWKYVCDWYNLPAGFNQESVKRELHRVGTTSFVLKVVVDNKDVRALKLLKYRFCSIQSLTEASRSAERTGYIEGYWKSSERFIAMDFIAGDTLAELMIARPKDVRTHCDKIAHNLCKELKRIGKGAHGDLNPYNIIVTDAETFELRLIDFGVNYLLREGIGDAASLVRASVYLAPEVIERPEASLMGDVYAMGVILLEMLSVSTVHSASASKEQLVFSKREASATSGRESDNLETQAVLGDQFRREEFDRLLMLVQIDSPGLSALIDDMLEPNLYLRSVAVFGGHDVFYHLQKRIDLEFLLRVERLSRKQYSPMTRLSNIVLGMLSGDPTGVVADRISEARKLESLAAESDYDDKRRDLIYLQQWSVIATISHFVVFFAFIFYAQKYSALGRLESSLPGLLILLSFSFVAVKYYQTIFGEMDVRDLGSRARLASLWMRFCTLYWPPAILLVYHYSPEHWSIATFYGTGVVAINNYLIWRLASSASNQLSSENLSSPAIAKTWLDNYRSWHTLMAGYAISMLIIGQLILHGFLHDVTTYAAIIILINLKMWFYNSTQDAVPLRYSLMRIFQRYRRLLAYSRPS